MSDYLSFEPKPRPTERKTDIWSVVHKQTRVQLGQIAWYGAWRKYVFFPEDNTLFDVGCLATISNFIQQQMALRKDQK